MHYETCSIWLELCHLGDFRILRCFRISLEYVCFIVQALFLFWIVFVWCLFSASFNLYLSLNINWSKSVSSIVTWELSKQTLFSLHWSVAALFLSHTFYIVFPTDFNCLYLVCQTSLTLSSVRSVSIKSFFPSILCGFWSSRW